ncbi:metal-dependent hydrolase [Paraflavisolibacter sp. H34]|uniref:metal-dependent hydrolase n=1 Tax=Huijunlia imazamoxiresistens TaxID=3127457 RepID=UPI00301687DB
MKFTYYGHSCFAVELNGKKVLFDPFITPNELAKNVDVSSIEADFILVSHGHGDHLADCVAIAKRTGALVVTSFEVADWLGKQGVPHTLPMNHGGKKDLDFGTVKCVNAVHSSSLPDGSYGGNPMGFLLYGADKSFYYSGDTALTTDMQLIPRWTRPDFSVLCIGDHFTMGIDDAVEAARMVQTTQIVGVHYDTFPYIKIDQQQAKDTFSAAGLTLHLPGIGESIDL